MQLSMYQVDAFASRLFSGNPAAVCPLQDWLPDETLQAIAAENNLSETAFFVGDEGRIHLRWFTPACEVDLCGHATLASAYVLFEELGTQSDAVVFSTKSGDLSVRRDGTRLVMDSPAGPPQPIRADPGLVTA